MGCPDDNLLVAMAEQKLEPAKFAELENHIDRCASCRRLLAVAVADGSLAVGTPLEEPEIAPTDPFGSYSDVSVDDRYVVKTLLGRGGMGSVYLARDLTLDREVALKVHRTGTGVQRLQREAMAMAKLAHPNVVTVYEVATVDDRLYVAMEYVRGETLRGWLTSQARSWREIIAMLLEAGNGLVAAHAAGLVHRDFKPENVLVGDDGRPRVGDFGLARVGASPSTTFRRFVPADVSTETAETLPSDQGLDASMTQTGAILGTPAYMAPEQLAAEQVDARCDQFAFCVVAWEALYGQRPFTGASLAAIEAAIAERRINEPVNTDVPQRVRAVLERGLATEPAARFPDMLSLLAALRHAAAPRTKRQIAMTIATVAALGAAGFGVWSMIAKRRHDAVCAEAGAQMRRTFDEDKRGALVGAFKATGAPFAADAAARTSDVLARTTSVLATQAIGVCRSTAERPELAAAKRACLAERRDAVAALATVLAQPDKSIVERAPTSAWGLYEPAPCTDAPTLLAQSAHRSTISLAEAAQVNAIKRFHDTGNYQAGIAAGTSLVAAARASGNKGLELDASLALGGMQSDVEAPEARGTYETAIALAETLGRDLDAAVGYAGLANVAGMNDHKPADAHRFIALARAKLERLGGKNPASRGELLAIEAQVLLDENRLGEAETAMRQSVSVIEDAYGPEHPKLGSALGTLSQILRSEGKTQEAESESQRTLAILEHALGPEHPTVAGAHMNLAQDLMTLKRYSDAREHLMRADIVFARVFGDVHPMRAAIAGNLGTLEQMQGNWDAALVASRRAVSILEQVEGPDTADVSGAHRDIALELSKAGRHGEAVVEQTRAIAILEKLGADVEGRLVSGLTELSGYELAAKMIPQAVAHAERALAVAAKRPADANPADVIEAKLALANAVWETKRDPARVRQIVNEVRAMAPERRAELDKWLAAHPPK